MRNALAFLLDHVKVPNSLNTWILWTINLLEFQVLFLIEILIHHLILALIHIKFERWRIGFGNHFDFKLASCSWILRFISWMDISRLRWVFSNTWLFDSCSVWTSHENALCWGYFNILWALVLAAGSSTNAFKVVVNKRMVAYRLTYLQLFGHLWLMTWNYLSIERRCLFWPVRWWVIVRCLRSLGNWPLNHEIWLRRVRLVCYLTTVLEAIFLSFKTRILASDSCSLAYWVDFTHLDHGGLDLNWFRVALSINVVCRNYQGAGTTWLLGSRGHHHSVSHLATRQICEVHATNLAMLWSTHGFSRREKHRIYIIYVHLMQLRVHFWVGCLIGHDHLLVVLFWRKRINTHKWCKTSHWSHASNKWLAVHHLVLMVFHHLIPIFTSLLASCNSSHVFSDHHIELLHLLWSCRRV